MKKRILVVDDEEGIRFTFNIFLSEQGYDVCTVASYDEARGLLGSTEFDLIFADIVLDRKTGVDLLKIAKKLHPTTPVVMITGVPSIETATESLRIGALDYIIKPIRQDTLLRVTSMALKHRAVAEEKESCRLNFEAIFRSVKDGILTVGNTAEITEINNAATRICAVPRDHVLNQPIHTLTTKCSGNCLPIIRQVLEKKVPVDDVFIECHAANNKRQVISISGAPLIGPGRELTGAVTVLRDETRLQELERTLEEHKELETIIGQAKTIRSVKTLIRELASLQTTVLITGESGTGKELVVDALHRIGNQNKTPLVKVNCAALSETLLESELFGHIRGAFTGAISNKIGLFERAHGGTIFLDEIGDISLRMQSRLLRVIETGEFDRVGDSKTIKADIRVVAATNQNLKKKAASGDFRQDLFYRLKVVEINLPPLRERREDIPLLIEHFLERFNHSFSKKIKGVSAEAFSILMLHSWPGNIRELENSLEHAYVRCRQKIITTEHLPPEFQTAALRINTSEPADRKFREAQEIKWALKETAWNKTQAAHLLGVSRRTIYRKIDKYRITQKA